MYVCTCVCLQQSDIEQNLYGIAIIWETKKNKQNNKQSKMKIEMAIFCLIPKSPSYNNSTYTAIIIFYWRLFFRIFKNIAIFFGFFI